MVYPALTIFRYHDERKGSRSFRRTDNTRGIHSLVFKPIAVNLERRTEERLITMNMVLEGISLITKRRLPSFIEETLNSFVANYHDEIRDANVKPRPDVGSALKG